MSPTRNERVRQASQARRAQQKEDVRQAILRATADLLQEKGYEGFSLRQVSERIGYSCTSIYLYFEDKDHLLSVLVQEKFDYYVALMQEAASQHADPLERLMAIARAYIHFGRSDLPYFRGIYLQRPDILVKFIGRERLAASRELIRAALQEAMAAGQIAQGNVEEIAQVMWATVHGIVTLTATVPCAMENVDNVVERAIQLVGRGLR